jgi:hypothetical protein
MTKLRLNITMSLDGFVAGPNHWECWLRDPDGYTVVLASPDGTAGGSWHPPANG